jgi:hypothetical protein
MDLGRWPEDSSLGSMEGNLLRVLWCTKDSFNKLETLAYLSMVWLLEVSLGVPPSSATQMLPSSRCVWKYA